MLLRPVFLAIAFVIAFPALADEPSMGPVIEGYGPAVRNLLDEDDNPNLELIALLQQAGVEFYVCGQSMTFGGIAKNELTGGIKIALSAMTMLTILQSENYALLPWGA